MDLADSLWQDVVCPVCGQPGAKKRLWQVKCRNMSCSKFDMSLLYGEQVPAGVRAPTSPSPIPQAKSFDQGSNSINLRYRNYRGEEKTFVGDRTTVRLKGNHISLRLAPTGQRVTFSRDRIRNLAEFDEITRKQPSPKERRVLEYHKKRGSTSALYESLRRKYPGW